MLSAIALDELVTRPFAGGDTLEERSRIELERSALDEERAMKPRGPTHKIAEDPSIDFRTLRASSICFAG